MICHVTILLQPYIIDKINIIFDGLKKRNWVITFFSFILKLISLTFLIWNNCPFDFNRKVWGKTSFSMPSFNLELFKHLNLNFMYIHSKHRKWGVFYPDLWEKPITIHLNKVNLPPICQLPLFSIFGHMTCDMSLDHN